HTSNCGTGARQGDRHLCVAALLTDGDRISNGRSQGGRGINHYLPRLRRGARRIEACRSSAKRRRSGEEVTRRRAAASQEFRRASARRQRQSSKECRDGRREWILNRLRARGPAEPSGCVALNRSGNLSGKEVPTCVQEEPFSPLSRCFF